MIDILILAGYGIALAGLATYSVHRGWLLLAHRRGDAAPEVADAWKGPLPHITVQLPLYNERYVVGRLLDAVSALDYPRDRLQIQVLDDSTDETSAIARKRVRYHRRRGVPIDYLQRGSRYGYKAGALAYGLQRARGELVLILDADFVPPPDLLHRMIPAFRDPRVGMVQARWGHINEHASWLTRAQALLLDAHFLIEHGGRAAAGLFFNFNGTAGIWRAACLRDAGGWQADTLTEDLDLSYRAQMRGWRFVFLPDVVVPGELPDTVRAFKGQQARWAQGSIQTARKTLPHLLRGDWPWRIKLEALAHLTSYVPAGLTLALSVLVFPAAVVRFDHGWPLLLFADLILLAAALGPLLLFYGEALRSVGRPAWPTVLLRVPAILVLGIGLSLNNTRALLAGLSGFGGSEFVRTPKRGRARHGYRPRASGWIVGAEVGLAGYVALAVTHAALNGLYPSIPFLLLFQFGFVVVAAGSIRQLAHPLRS